MKYPILGVPIPEKLRKELQRKKDQYYEPYLSLMANYMIKGMTQREASFQTCKDLFGHYPIK